MALDEVPRIAEERPAALASIVDNPAHAVLVALRCYETISYYSAAMRIFGLNVEAWQYSTRQVKDIVWQTLLDLEDLRLVRLHRIGTIYRADGVEEPMIVSVSDATHRYTQRYEKSNTPLMENEDDGRRKSNRWNKKAQVPASEFPE